MASILLVEDSKFLRIATERALAKAGYQVVCTAVGEEALAQATAKLADLVLLDMLIPKLSGPQVLQALRKNPITAHIPVLVLSSLAQKNEEKLIQEGATAFLEKGSAPGEPQSPAQSREEGDGEGVGPVGEATLSPRSRPKPPPKPKQQNLL